MTETHRVEGDLRTLSYEAAIYFYPLVTMDITRLQTINRTGPGSGPPTSSTTFANIRPQISAQWFARISTPSTPWHGWTSPADR